MLRLKKCSFPRPLLLLHHLHAKTLVSVSCAASVYHNRCWPSPILQTEKWIGLLVFPSPIQIPNLVALNSAILNQPLHTVRLPARSDRIKLPRESDDNGADVFPQFPWENVPSLAIALHFCFNHAFYPIQQETKHCFGVLLAHQVQIQRFNQQIGEFLPPFVRFV